MLTSTVVLVWTALLASPCFGCEWSGSHISWTTSYQRRPGFIRVSVGQAGVWAIKKYNNYICYIDGSYQAPGQDGPCKTVPTFPLQPYAIDVGVNTVVALTSTDGVKRENISSDKPKGDKLVFELRGIVSDLTSTPDGTFHMHHTDRSISAGRSGFWSVDIDGYIMYHQGSYEDNEDLSGTPTIVPSMQAIGKAKRVVSGEDFVLAINEKNEVWKRGNISAADPDGDFWTKVSEDIIDVDVDCCFAWGVRSNGTLVRAKL